MAVEIKVPPLGESVVEATVGRWTKSEGDAVARDEVLVELETDKITVEVSAPEAGTLGSISKQEGDTVGVGDLLGTVEAVAPAAVGAGKGTETGAGGDDPAQGAEKTPPPASATSGAEGDVGNGTGGATSPSVRRIAEERGIDLSRVQGSGPRGRITVEDLEGTGETAAPRAPAEAAPAPQKQKAAAPATPPACEDGRPIERERMSRRRQTIARRLVEAQQTTASLTTFNEVDLSAVMAMRKRRQEDFVKKHDIKLGFMSFFVKASIGALKQFPRLNGEIDGDEIVLKHFYDIGIAVGTDEGLVVPVIREADQKSFAEIEHAIAEVAVKARDGKLALADLQGGTFTITNGGIYGSMLSTPILNPPQVGILGMHNIVQRPMVVDGEITIRPMMYVALTYDHRIVDGSEAVQFLVAIKGMIEDPETMLLEG